MRGKRKQQRDETKAFADAGQAAGAALGTSVKTVRKGATHAGHQLAGQLSDGDSLAGAAREIGTSAQQAAQRVATEQLKPLAGDLADRLELHDRWGTAQDALGERLDGARRELATRIEPPRRRRRKKVLLVVLLGAVAGVATAATLARRPQPASPGASGAPGDSAANGAVTSQDPTGGR